MLRPENNRNLRPTTNGGMMMDLNALTGLFNDNSGSVVLNVLLSIALIWSVRQLASKEKIIQNYQKRDEENEKQLNQYNRTLVKLLIERGSTDKTNGEEVVDK
ncbi:MULTISPECIES: hypothetical protein [Paenibacillus]|uniref:hypothetical protein n=1 Tax=Paenibacillus TaxID=44249 RepID=UPI00117F49EB|nr:hypothetical protein [Paenibacillus borealis]